MIPDYLQSWVNCEGGVCCTEASAIMDKLITRAEAAETRVGFLVAEAHGWQPKLAAAEDEVVRLRARLAEADEIIDDCWHQFAIDIRGKLSPGGLSTLEMVDNYRNERDAAAPTKEGT